MIESATKKKPGTSKGFGAWKVRPIHRIIGSIILVFTLYFAVTGTIIQVVDLRALLSHAPATNPEMEQVREGINGPASYVVIQATDYAATPLPENFDFSAALANVVQGARKAVGDSTPLKFVELRTAGGKPIGLVRAGDKTLRFDAATGAPVHTPQAGRRAGGQERSIHAEVKNFHDMMVIGHLAASINAIVGIGLFAMIVTGLVLYFQMLGARSRAGLKGFFWLTGGWWRSLHRGISVVAAVFLLFVSFTGTLLAIDSVGLGIYQVTHKNAGKYARFPIGAVGDFSSPLSDAQLPAMLQTTLTAGRAAGASPIKVVRLRYFNGIPQGVLIAGNGDSTAQLVFNADTGKPMSLTEPGYPETQYHDGWEIHELIKKIHRGDAFGIAGRFLDLFAGLSLIYLSISGAVMYIDLWRRRRRGGRTALFWT